MEVFADLHLHSKHSRATSKDLDLENLAKYGKIKGLNLTGTADFCHPVWLENLKKKLGNGRDGIYEYEGMNFLLSVEISLMYTQGGKSRKIHHIILAPNFGVVDQINEWLDTKGRRDYDGRPIFGFSSIELVEKLMAISKQIEIIPAHVWTPWFSLFGSKSGFDSLEECFGDQAKHVHAIETGLSSDPAMNWRVSELDDRAIVSFSDAHSHWPWRLGRECTVFNVSKLTYTNVINAVRNNGIKTTLEFHPEEGKYHYDGHRKCGVCMKPEESREHGKKCPKCKQQMTIGVLHRVEDLAERDEGYEPRNAKPFRSLMPLSEIISAVKSSGVYTKTVWSEYNRLMDRFDTEFDVLLNVPEDELKKVVSEKLADVIMRNRYGRLKIRPGYDGVYGELVLSEQQGLGKFV